MVHLALAASLVGGTMLFAARAPHAVHAFHLMLRGIVHGIIG